MSEESISVEELERMLKELEKQPGREGSCCDCTTATSASAIHHHSCE